jgi:Protein of unknown function (DUF3631)
MTSELLTDVREFVRKYVVVNDEQAMAITLWVLHAHAAEAAYQTPYLHVSSPEKQSGKSRLLEVLELVVRDPMQAVKPSEAVIYRFVKDTPGATIMLDEVDTIWSEKGDDNEGLRALINAGHRRGATVPRCVNFTQIEHFPVFCPKVLAGIGGLPDTIADRSLPIRMKRKTKDERVERFRRRRAEPAGVALRTRLEQWATANVAALADAEPDLPEELSDRQQDACEPLLAIADLAGWGAEARVALCTLLAADEDDLRPKIQLLRDCRRAFDALGYSRVPTEWLINQLKGLEEVPWQTTDPGAPWYLSPNKLAFWLRPYEIKSKKIRFSTKGGDGLDGLFQGYERSFFEDAWNRYVPEETPDTVEVGT